MDKSNSSFETMPPIWSTQIWNDFQKSKNVMKKPDVAMFDNAPNEVTVWSFFWKIVIGVIIWVCVAALLFGSLTAIWWQTWWDSDSLNSMIKILLPVIWFVVGFVWNLALAWLYNIFFSKRYYNFGKMFWLIFASSIIIFIFFFPIYFLFKTMNSLYSILWFQIIFQLFISINLMDFLSQPNYSASSLMGNTLGCVLSVLLHVLITSFMGDSFNILFVIGSAVIAYMMTILWASIWDAIYYKFYEWWSNPFYLPSLSELREERQKEEAKKEKEEEEVNVEMK